MADYATADIRNLALVGHTGVGKTTLTEALLVAAGVIPEAGSVERGTTVSDFEEQEKAHQHSLSSSVISFDHDGQHINLVDTPGLPDFAGHALSALAGVETVAVVINAESGLDITARRMMDFAASRRLCRMIIINRMDADNTDLASLCKDVRATFGNQCLAINLPGAGGTAVVDCFFQPKGESDFLSVAEARTAIVDQVVEVDEKLMERYLEKGEVSPEELHDAFEQALREGHLVPVCFTSATSGAGVRQLLHIFDQLLPNPMEGNPPPFLLESGSGKKEVHADADPDKHVLAHVFKIHFDPFAGKLSYLRIHQGTITRDTQLFVGDARKAFKVGHLFGVRGKETFEMERGVPGDICAVSKVDETHFDSVLHDSHDEDHIHLAPLKLPMSLHGLAITARNRGDEQKIADVMHRMVEEDPCLQIEHNASANETVLRGLGELHLRISLEKMADRYHVEVDTQPPSIPYRETITAKAEGHHRHKKQTGGAGQFGEVFLRVEPLARGSGFEFADEVKGGVIPGQFIPAVEKGVRQVLDSGAIAGFPMRDLRVTVYDGKYHSVDSKEIAFVQAGKKAFVDAIGKARAIVLEPIVDLQITAPQACMGDIAGDLSSRRGRVSDTRAEGDTAHISGQAPLAELGDYQSKLKSMTGGEGTFSMDFAAYEPAPANVQKEIISLFKGVADDE
ncbi:MAG: elongation factor G [Gammaproteobacteria bacterium]|nr:elongation factor G [Gammaproteobacteria bacterium]